MSLSMTVKRLLNRFGYDIRYHRPFYETVVQPLGIRTVLDIGANDGTVATTFRTLFTEATVHAFEPLRDCFTLIEERAKRDARIIPHNYALGDSTERRDIERSSFHPSSSLLPMTALHKALYPKSAGSKKESIEVKRLDDIAESLALTLPLLVKIDVQGFEDRVIRGGKETLKRASVIVVETSFFELYAGQPLTDAIRSELTALGFSYYGAYQTHHSKKTGRPIYEDSVFISDVIRKEFETAELS